MKGLSIDTHPLSIQNDIDTSDENQKRYIETEKESEIVNRVFSKFRRAADSRDRNFKYFGGRNLVEVINDSVGRYIAVLDEREGIEDWQSRVHVPMTAQKVEAVLGKIVAQLPIAQISPRFDSDAAKVRIIDSIYQFSEDIDDYEELMLCAALEGIVKGTVIGYEGYEYKNREKRLITGVDEDGVVQFKNKTITESKLYGEIVPLEEFYPSSVGVRRIDDMPYCFRRKVIPYPSFVDEYSCYSRSINVQEKNSTGADRSTPSYLDYISSDVGEGNVEIIFYYNKDTDEYIILANGIWLNPLSDYSVSPLPHNHKNLPFWSARFSTLGSDFFYGKSLVDRISSLQDVLNVLTNMALDQSFLTMFPTILTAGIDPVEDDYLRPGRRIPVDTQGLPLNQAFMKLDLGTPSGWHQWIIQYSKSILEEASVDQTSSGQAGVGGRTTAEEIRTAAAGVAAILGVFGKLLNTGIKRKAALRVSNIQQFWTDKFSPIDSEANINETGIFKDAFNIITHENAPLKNGKRGNKIVAMYDNNSSLPTKSEVVTTAKLYEMRTGTKTQIDAITGDYIKDIQTKIALVPNPKASETKEVQKALALEKARVYLSLFPENVNKEELANDIAEKFGDDPAKMFNFQKQQTQPGEVPAEAASQQMSAEPQADVANNMVRGMMGGQTGDMQFRDMAQQ